LGESIEREISTAYIFAATLERRIANNFVASVLYSGSHSTNLVANGNQAGTVSYAPISMPSLATC